jgi:hypothetical protein
MGLFSKPKAPPNPYKARVNYTAAQEKLAAVQAAGKPAQIKQAKNALAKAEKAYVNSGAQFQDQQDAQRREEFRIAQENAQRIADSSTTQSRDQFAAAQAAQQRQFDLTTANQEARANEQMAIQQQQFAQAQAAQEAAMRAQMEQNERLAREAELAANRARGMQLVGDSNDAVRVKSAQRNKAKRRASLGTSQLKTSPGSGLSIGTTGNALSIG